MSIPSHVSRRGFLATAGLAAASAWFDPNRLFAQEKAEGIVQQMRTGAVTAKITTEKLRGNVSVLIGSGGNIAVLPGKDGKLLVDAGITGSRPQLTEALAAISSDPLKHLINTHWHFDHTDGNEWLHAAGATISAHENTRKHMATTSRIADWDFTFPPSPPGALPTTFINTERTLKLNGTTVVVRYYGPSHTDGDLSIYFPDADVLHCGDTFWNGHYPFIDNEHGGSIDGMIRAAGVSLGKAGPKTIFIPGHGPVGEKSHLTEFRDVLAAAREKIAALKKQGKSLEEVIAANPTAAYDEKWGTFAVNPAFFAKLVYAAV